MLQPHLIIVSGPPCVGKTTLARRMARELVLSLVTKDDIKESLFDSLGWSDRAWSRKLGTASYALLFYFVEALVSAGRPLIAESNFDARFHSERLRSLQDKYGVSALQVQCYADGAVLRERFRARAFAGARHPGHVEHLQWNEQAQVLEKGRLENLEIVGKVIQLDMSDFAAIDYAALFAEVRAWMSEVKR
jgi:predicted kinase